MSGRLGLDLREKFPATRGWAYLNTATAGPVALEVARAAFDSYEDQLQNGDANWEGALEGVEATRAAVATLAGAKTREICFTRNTSHSASLAAQMLWDAGARRVLVMRDEFPSSTLPFLHRGFDVRFLERSPEGYTAQRIADASADRDVVIASHVMYATGERLDLVAIGAACRAQKVDFCVCVTQSLGGLRVSFEESGATILMGTSHKWMCAGYGGGILGIRESEQDRFRWPQVGWLSAADPGELKNDTLELSRHVRALEMGCQPYPNLLSLGAAARLWLDTGVDDIEARILALTRQLRGMVRDAGHAVALPGGPLVSGITIVATPQPHAVAARMKAMGIAVQPRGAGVRLAVHAFNNERDLTRAVEAFGVAIAEG